jgi:hypothetical protein
MSFDWKKPGYGFDSRDVEERREALENDLADVLGDIEQLDEVGEDLVCAIQSLVALSGREEDYEEYIAINALKDAVYSPEWAYGIQFIAEGQFTNHCQEMLMDCGVIPRDFPNFVEVDWGKTADNLRRDYTEVELAGDNYLYRA